MIKFSEAIALGRMLIKHNDGTYTFYDHDKDGVCEGCAVGMALAAVGRTTPADANTVSEYWPWVTSEYGGPWWTVSEWYFQVVRGLITLDELIEKVKVLESQHEDKLAVELEYATVT